MVTRVLLCVLGVCFKVARVFWVIAIAYWPKFKDPTPVKEIMFPQVYCILSNKLRIACDVLFLFSIKTSTKRIHVNVYANENNLMHHSCVGLVTLQSLILSIRGLLKSLTISVCSRNGRHI